MWCCHQATWILVIWYWHQSNLLLLHQTLLVVLKKFLFSSDLVEASKNYRLEMNEIMKTYLQTAPIFISSRRLK